MGLRLKQNQSRNRTRVSRLLDPAPGQEVTRLPISQTYLDGDQILHGGSMRRLLRCCRCSAKHRNHDVYDDSEDHQRRDDGDGQSSTATVLRFVVLGGGLLEAQST